MILIALALLAAEPAAASQPSSPAVQSDRKAAAHLLAEMVAPRQTLVALNMKWGKRAVLDMPQTDADSKELEASYPGIHAAMWAAVEAEMHRQMEADVPRLWARMEQVYMTELTTAQIDSLNRFYRTPTGQRIIAGLYGNIDLTNAFSSDDSETEKALDEAGKQARSKMIAQLKPDPADLALLDGVITMRHMTQVGSLIEQATNAWYKEDNPADQKRINDLMAAAVERYMTAKDAA